MGQERQPLNKRDNPGTREATLRQETGLGQERQPWDKRDNAGTKTILGQERRPLDKRGERHIWDKRDPWDD